MTLTDTSTPRRLSRPFMVMAKPIGATCNLDCGYCYYLDTAAHTGGGIGQPVRMTDDVLEAYVRQFIEASPGPVVHFCWHGGEPTLAGVDFLRRAVDLQRRQLPSGWQCWNNLQTNGTLLDDEWCEFLAAEHFEVGVSIDGPALLHDVHRRDKGGRASHAIVEDAVRRLLAHGVTPDLLCTVTPATAAAGVDVYRYLRDLSRDSLIQFLPVVKTVDGGVTTDSLTGADYGRFLVAVFDEWVHHDVGFVHVQTFEEAIRAWSGRAAGMCITAPTCGQVLVVEHDGGVYSCDHFVRPDHRLGSLTDTPLADLVAGEQQTNFGWRKRTTLPQDCLACPWLDACNGGCPKDRPDIGTDTPGRNHLCDGLRAFYEHADPYLKRLVALMERADPTPEAIAAEVRAADRAAFAGVGRNDPCPCGSGRKAKHCCLRGAAR